MFEKIVKYSTDIAKGSLSEKDCPLPFIFCTSRSHLVQEEGEAVVIFPDANEREVCIFRHQSST